jgi:hypothetical protein
VLLSNEIITNGLYIVKRGNATLQDQVRFAHQAQVQNVLGLSKLLARINFGRPEVAQKHPDKKQFNEASQVTLPLANMGMLSAWLPKFFVAPDYTPDICAVRQKPTMAEA